MDPEIPAESVTRQISCPPEAAPVRGVPGKPVVDKRLSVQEEHVHVMIQIKPSDSVASVVQVLKGGTSKVIRKEFPELEEFLWGESFWADGYFAESVGKVDEEVVKRYIRAQQR